MAFSACYRLATAIGTIRMSMYDPFAINDLRGYAVILFRIRCVIRNSTWVRHLRICVIRMGDQVTSFRLNVVRVNALFRKNTINNAQKSGAASNSRFQIHYEECREIYVIGVVRFNLMIVSRVGLTKRIRDICFLFNVDLRIFSERMTNAFILRFSGAFRIRLKSFMVENFMERSITYAKGNDGNGTRYFTFYVFKRCRIVT